MDKNTLLKYDAVLFSDGFYKLYQSIGWEVEDVKEFRFNALEKFLIFYDKYVVNEPMSFIDVDKYNKSKEVYDQILIGALCVDEVLDEYENILTSTIIDMYIDEYKLSTKK